MDLWWDAARKTLDRQDALAVNELPADASQALARMAGRTMKLQVTIHDGHISITDHDASIGTELRVLKERS